MTVVGMTLRQHYAACVVSHVTDMVNTNPEGAGKTNHQLAQDVAMISFLIADALIAHEEEKT